MTHLCSDRIKSSRLVEGQVNRIKRKFAIRDIWNWELLLPWVAAALRYSAVGLIKTIYKESFIGPYAGALFYVTCYIFKKDTIYLSWYTYIKFLCVTILIPSTVTPLISKLSLGLNLLNLC